MQTCKILLYYLAPVMYLAQFFFPSVSSGSLLIYFSLMKTLIPLCWWWSLIFLSLIRSLMFSLHVTGFQNAFHSFSVVLLSPWRWNPPPSWRKPLSPLAEAKWQRGSRSFVYQYAPSAFCLQEELCVCEFNIYFIEKFGTCQCWPTKLFI